MRPLSHMRIEGIPNWNTANLSYNDPIIIFLSVSLVIVLAQMTYFPKKPRRSQNRRLPRNKNNEKKTMNVQTRHPYEGLLHKYTNAMKGWQYRWFILSPETGELHYFLSESEKNQRPRCSIYLAGAVIAPSDEDSNTFTVNSATGDMIKLRATDARARQEWVDKLRAVTEMYTRAIASSHPPLPPREHSGNSSRNPVVKLEVLDAFANCQEQLRKVEKHNLALAQSIENSDLHLDSDLLVLKAMAHTTLHTLSQCLNILYQ